MFQRLLVPTISYLLDFSSGPDLQCSLGQFYDPVYRRCYSLSCAGNCAR